MSLITPIPNGPFYSAPSNYINSPQGFLVVGSGLSVAPDGTLLVASALGGTVSQVTAGVGLSASGVGTSGGMITTTGTINLLPATLSTLGGIKVGANLNIAPDGTLSAFPPGIGTISGVIAGAGLQGGGSSGNVTLSLQPASTTQFGGVSIAVNGGITISSGTISLTPASTTQRGGVILATSAEVIAGLDNVKAVTPATLAAKVASTTARGIVQLSDSVATNDSTKAATQTAAKTAYDAALTAQATANAALPKSGGVMTGLITFAAGQTFPGVALPKATTSSLGVIQVGTGLSINSSGILSTANNGTVTSITPGPGLGAPATGNVITSAGTLRLLPPTGTSLGGVKAGSNILIGVDGTISTDGLLKTNNPQAYNSYIFPAPDSFGMAPGTDGQVFTLIDHATGTVGWTSTGTLTSVVAGTGVNVVSTATTATVSLATVPSIPAVGSVGRTAFIPTLTFNQYGQVTSMGEANCYTPFQIPTYTAPFNLVLDFGDNYTNWEFTIAGSTTIMNPLNAQSGQRGSLLITQDPLTPYMVTWGTSWEFPNFAPFTGGGIAEKSLIDFVVVAGNRIIVTAIVPNIG